MRYLVIDCLFVLLLLLCSCHGLSTHRNVIAIQPFEDFSPILTEHIYKEIKKVVPKTFELTPIELPIKAYTAERNRYRADTLVQVLGKTVGHDTTIIGLTNKDISATKDEIKDWGVMGLGNSPGNACIISTFRLSKSNLDSQLFKLAMHELGHTEGLPHCANKTCYMRDAEGGNHLDEENGFCNSCKSYLKQRGWLLL